MAKQFRVDTIDLGVLPYITASLSANERIVFDLSADSLIQSEEIAGTVFFIYEKLGPTLRASSDSNAMISATDWSDTDKTITVEIDTAFGTVDTSYWLFARPTLVSGLRTPIIHAFFKISGTVTT